MALWVVFRGVGPLSYILFGSRYREGPELARVASIFKLGVRDLEEGPVCPDMHELYRAFTS